MQRETYSRCFSAHFLGPLQRTPTWLSLVPAMTRSLSSHADAKILSQRATPSSSRSCRQCGMRAAIALSIFGALPRRGGRWPPPSRRRRKLCRPMLHAEAALRAREWEVRWRAVEDSNRSMTSPVSRQISLPSSDTRSALILRAFGNDEIELESSITLD
jgi:hypothetical protein